jgi:F-type H+-transporting ATPase subunit delta
MSNLRTAHRYAAALMATADEQKALKKVSKDLRAIHSLIGESHEFQLFLKSPIIKKEKKRQVLEVLFEKTVQPLTLQFLSLLAEKGREDILLDIIETFFQLEDEAMGLVKVQVKAASSLSKKQLTALEERFAAYTKKNVELTVAEDEQLIGGFIARIGDTVFDGSVKRQLELLRKRFAEVSATA